LDITIITMITIIIIIVITIIHYRTLVRAMSNDVCSAVCAGMPGSSLTIFGSSNHLSSRKTPRSPVIVFFSRCHGSPPRHG
jgi:hypothetical protein